MKPGEIVTLDVNGEKFKGRVTDKDSHGRLKVEFWLWPLQLDEWWEENAK